jgi:hypothetical protein
VSQHHARKTLPPRPQDSVAEDHDVREARLCRWKDKARFRLSTSSELKNQLYRISPLRRPLQLLDVRADKLRDATQQLDPVGDTLHRLAQSLDCNPDEKLIFWRVADLRKT